MSGVDSKHYFEANLLIEAAPEVDVMKSLLKAFPGYSLWRVNGDYRKFILTKDKDV